MRKLVQLSIAITLFGTLTACSNAPVERANQSLKIVASFYPMAEFARQIAGDHAEVITLIPAGVEPHDWEPSAKDMETIESADLLVYNGSGMEGFAEQVIDTLDLQKTSVVEASLSVKKLITIEEESALDPHVWLSPITAQQEVIAISNAIQQKDPTNKKMYVKNTALFLEKLRQLDALFQVVSTAPKHKEFVTAHAAFGYIAHDYQLIQVPLSGLSPEQEPSAGQLADVSKLIHDKQIKTIFFETLVSPKIAETIAKETGSKTAVLNPIEGLTEDELKAGKNYISIMKQNAEALQIALNE